MIYFIALIVLYIRHASPRGGFYPTCPLSPIPKDSILGPLLSIASMRAHPCAHFCPILDLF